MSIDPKITAFRNAYTNQAFYTTLSKSLKRIKDGASKEQVLEIRGSKDNSKADMLKRNLPSFVYAGEFTSRKDESIITHSGYIVLDFDKLENPQYTKEQVFKHEFIKAAWISPSGNGVKALARIADGKKHQEHFNALRDVFPVLDKSGSNVSRLCFESWDDEILIRETTEVFKKVKRIDTVHVEEVIKDENVIFDKISLWLNNRGDSFSKGERNLYIYKLAGACCRYGISESRCLSLIYSNVTSGSSDFSKHEIEQSVESAYKTNEPNSVEFKHGVLIVKETSQEVKFDESIYDLSIKPKDVIYGIDCKQDALDLYRNGYEKVLSTGCAEIDKHFKFKKGELTLLTGIGNYGKSTFMKYLLLLQILNGKKVAVFSPEEAPAHEFYNDFVEMYFGKNCLYGEDRPSEFQYEKVFDLLTKNIFFIYPKDIAPTPDYIKEKFLELIIKEKIEFCVIDPFNQMTNEYQKSGGRSDKYLETLLSDFGRFAKTNDVYFIIIAHPKMLMKKPDGNYPCPDVFDIADGAMWNNKMDNILVYHLPFRQTDEQNPMCEFHAKKIRKRKSVGQIGMVQFEYIPRTRRFIIGGKDYVDEALNKEVDNQTTLMKPNTFFYEVEKADPFEWEKIDKELSTPF